MSKLNASKNVKALTETLLGQLITYANGEQSTTVYSRFEQKIITKWTREQHTRPQLVVWVRSLRDLSEILNLSPLAAKPLPKVGKEDIRNALKVLEKRLGILKDRRFKTQGSTQWEFSLTLWSETSVDKNLLCFDEVWQGKNYLPKKDTAKTSIIKIPKQTPIFTGRQTEIQQLLKYLNFDYRAHIIFVSGVGGIGKTELVLEVAHRCGAVSRSKAYPSSSGIPRFEVIIFMTSKENYTSPNYHDNLNSQKRGHIQNIFRSIAQAFDNQRITRTSEEEQTNHVYECLSKQNNLLIIDNFDAIHQDEVPMVAAFLDNMPATTKVVVTTRNQNHFLTHLEVGKLNFESSCNLIRKEAQRKKVKLKPQDILDISHQNDGIPLALIFSVARKSKIIGDISGMPLSSAMPSGFHDLSQLEVGGENLNSSAEEKVQAAIQTNFGLLFNKQSHEIAMTLAIFRKDAGSAALLSVSNISELEQLYAGLEELDNLSIIQQTDARYRLLPPVREYALLELNKYPNFRNAAEERWVKWYLQFVKINGGRDWSDWNKKYEKLNSEWKNIISVLEYCANRVDCIEGREPYEFVYQIWFLVSPFASLYGYWSDRIHWLEWLIRASQKLKKFDKTAKAMSQKAYTLALMNKLSQANAILSEAWSMNPSLDPRTKTYLAHNQAFVFLRQESYQQATLCLQTEEKILQQANFSLKERQRRDIAIAYYRAEILFYLGKHKQNAKSLKQAKHLYSTIEQRADSIDWQRMKNNAQIRQAAIAIGLGDFLPARELLQSILVDMRWSQDLWGVASYEATFAQLEAQDNKGSLTESQKWASTAQDKFHRLGMEKEEQEMIQLLSSF